MESNFDEFDVEHKPFRRGLLPWWIRFFSWLFMIMGGLSVINFFIFIFGVGFDASLYGLEDVIPYPYAEILILFILMFNGITGYLLWFEKQSAVQVARINAGFGIAVCLLSMILAITQGNFTLRLEIILLGVFISKLNEIKFEWEVETRART